MSKWVLSHRANGGDMNKCMVSMLLVFAASANAALTIDRSRLILNEGERSISVNVENRNQHAPYLAQAWMEDINEAKSNHYIAVLPPLQRVEAGAKTKVRLQPLPNITALPQDRESVLFFNLREIPPKSDQPNVFSLALQSRIKVFYRPKGIAVESNTVLLPGAREITLTRQGDGYAIHNPTPYHFSFVEARDAGNRAIKRFTPVMVPPKSTDNLSVLASEMGGSPTLVYLNDFGSQRALLFSCDGKTCRVSEELGKVKVVMLDE